MRSPGDTVIIFDDPVDKKIIQGTAILKKKIMESDIFEFWEVKSLETGLIQRRLIMREYRLMKRGSTNMLGINPVSCKK